MYMFSKRTILFHLAPSRIMRMLFCFHSITRTTLGRRWKRTTYTRGYTRILALIEIISLFRILI